MTPELTLQKPNLDDIFRRIPPKKEEYDPELALFIRDFKSKNMSLTKVEDMEQLSIGTLDPLTMSEEEKRRLIEVNTINRSHISEEYTEDVRETFEESLSEDNMFYALLFNKKDILAFVRVQKESENGRKSIGSLNVIEDLQNSGLGSLFYEEILKRESKDNILRGNTNPFYKFFKHHVEDYGFNADEVVPYGASGEMHVNVVLDERENEMLSSRKKTKMEIIRELEDNENIKDYEIYSFNPEEEEFKEEFIDLLKQKLNAEGKLLTRYIVSPEDSGKIYIVIESKKI